MRPTLRLAVLLPAAALLSACGVFRGGSAPAGPGLSTTPTTAEPVGAAPPSVDAFVQDGLLLPGITREELRRELGEPTRVQVEPMENRHDPAVQDSVIAWTYPGIAFYLHQVGNGGPELLSDVEVMDNRFLRYPQAGIGVARERIRELMGPPGEGDPDPAVDLYACRACDGPFEPVRFHYDEQGRVARILFSFYVD